MKSLKTATWEFLKRNSSFFAGLALLSWVVIVNIFPEGYVFGGGDTFQMIEAKKVFWERFYEWESRASMFYLVFYLLDLAGVSETAQLSWYLGIFIFGSYVSFYLFSRLVLKKVTKRMSVLASLFYALNLYTFFIFTGNWGFSYFPSLYIFLPLLAASLIKFLRKKTYFWMAIFLLVLFFSSSGFGNVAFALSFGVFSFFAILFLYFFGFVRFDKNLMKKLIILATLSFLVSAHWLFPVISRMKQGIEGITSDEHVIEYDYIIKKRASPISNTVSLINYTESYFPHKFPNETLEILRPLFFFLAFIPIFLVLAGLFKLPKLEKKQRRLFLSFFALLVLFIMLTAKVREPFEIINHYIYNIWGFSVLRGFDKTAIFIPFIMAVLVLITMSGFKNKKLAFISLAAVLMIPLPFYVGKIQQNIGYRLSEKNDFKETNLSFLVKIPEEYYGIRQTINNSQKKSMVATLPVSRNDGSGIVSYPKWKYYGSDITKNLYDKSLIEANRQYFDDWNFQREFDSQKDGDFLWIVKLLGAMNAEYIIFHKDVDEEYVENSQWKMEELEEAGAILSLEDNDYFILYKIDDEYFVPYITWQDEKVSVDKSPESVNKSFEKIKNGSMQANFKQINPKKFVVEFDEKVMGGNIVLAEKYDPLWKAYTCSESGNKNELMAHFKTRGYANGWEIPDNIKASKIIIEYYPIRLMWKGIALSLATISFLLAYLLKYYYDKKRNVG